MRMLIQRSQFKQVCRKKAFFPKHLFLGEHFLEDEPLKKFLGYPDRRAVHIARSSNLLPANSFCSKVRVLSTLKTRVFSRL